MNNQIDDITLEVRKAYRFLFEYQSRVLGLMRFIQRHYGMHYYGGYSKFSDSTPPSGKGNLNNWAWDWLNMYFYQFSFYYGDDKSGETGKFFSVFLVNDTGFYDKRDESVEEGTDDRIKLDNFESVEKSQTRLFFVANHNKWIIQDSWQAKKMIFDTEGAVIEYPEGKIVYKGYDLSSFTDSDSTLEQMRDFSNLCQENSIDIKIMNDEK